MKFKDALQKAIQQFDSKEFLQRIQEEDKTMMKQLPILKQINEYGFLTTESQAGQHEKGLSYVNNKPYEMKERAYLCGFLSQDKAAKFIQQISIDTDKIAMYLPICSDKIKIPSTLDIPLTIVIKGDQTQVVTHTSSALPQSTGNFFRKMTHINKSENVVFVFCWDLKWCRLASGKNGLFMDVLRILKTI